MSTAGWRAEADGQGLLVALSGDWIARDDADDGRQGAVDTVMRQVGTGALRFDGSALGHWDSALLVFLAGLREAATKAGSENLRVPARILLPGQGLDSDARRL